jgi:hypothetical protein
LNSTQVVADMLPARGPGTGENAFPHLLGLPLCGLHYSMFGYENLNSGENSRVGGVLLGKDAIHLLFEQWWVALCCTHPTTCHPPWW